MQIQSYESVYLFCMCVSPLSVIGCYVVARPVQSQTLQIAKKKKNYMINAHQNVEELEMRIAERERETPLECPFIDDYYTQTHTQTRAPLRRNSGCRKSETLNFYESILSFIGESASNRSIRCSGGKWKSGARSWSPLRIEKWKYADCEANAGRLNADRHR